MMPAFGGRVDHYDLLSTAYTVSFGKLRAVILGNYPSNPTDSLEHFGKSMDFLSKELKYAEDNKNYVMLFFHDLGDNMDWREKIDRTTGLDNGFTEFAGLVKGSRVLAVFSGHWHQAGGRDNGDLRDEMKGKASSKLIKNAWGDNIPMIRSFSSEARKFVALEYNELACEWRFGSVNAKDGEPSWWYHPGESSEMHQKSYTLRDCTVNLAASSQEPTLQGIVRSSCDGPDWEGIYDGMVASAHNAALLTPLLLSAGLFLIELA